MKMVAEWDANKAASNVVKHGISFASALKVFQDPSLLIVTAAREGDGEERRKAIGRIGDRIFTVVFVERGGVVRMISARRSNTPEERLYADRSPHY